MPMINLKNLDPDYPDGVILNLPDALVEVYAVARRHENAYLRRRSYHHAYYSLDACDGIENEAKQKTLTPEECFLRKLSREQLREALEQLSPIQARRIYDRYILGKKCGAIARKEGVSCGAVSDSIHAGLKNLKRYYERHFFEKEW